MLKEMHKENTYIASINEENFALARSQAEFLNISKNEEYSLKYWFKYDGSFYYLKYSDNLNEFIGEYLAKRLKLKSARYIPVMKNGSILIASRNFEKLNCEYLTVEDLEKKLDIEELLNNPEYNHIRTQLFKMFSLDMYMRQIDRSIPNLLFQVDTEKNLSLAPIFDYTNSFNIKNYPRYDNPILDIYMEKKKFDVIASKYPELYDDVLKVLNIELEQVLEEICDEFDFELKEEYKSYYLEQEEASKKILRKMI